MTYIVICKYCPDVGTFRVSRGAWRVVDSYAVRMLAQYRRVQVFDVGRDGKLLAIASIKPRQRNSWCSPRRILYEWMEARL